eukprot:scaffold6363_cov25-Tisochrysis_lutea.AAC.10
MAGRVPRRSAPARASSSASITTRPLMAFCSEASEERMMAVTGYSACAASRSNASGRRAAMSSAMRPSISSLPLPPPPPPPVRACVRSMASKSSRVSFRSLVMAAFSCNPKTPGASADGRPRIASRYSACDSAAGCAYAGDPSAAMTGARAKPSASAASQ